MPEKDDDRVRNEGPCDHEQLRIEYKRVSATESAPIKICNDCGLNLGVRKSNNQSMASNSGQDELVGRKLAYPPECKDCGRGLWGDDPLLFVKGRDVFCGEHAPDDSALVSAEYGAKGRAGSVVDEWAEVTGVEE